MRAVGRRIRAILLQRCPRCLEGKVFRGRFEMNDPCPVCGLTFEREPGYFFGAMYVSYLLAVVFLTTFYFIGEMLLPEWNSLVIALLAVIPYLPLMPAVFRYSRTIWMHFDRWASPTELSTNKGWRQWRETAGKE